MKHKRKKEHFSIQQAFCFHQNNTSSVCLEKQVLHLSPEGEIEIENPGKILQFDPECFVIEFDDKALEMKGQNLCVKTLKKNLIAICGTIFSVNILYGGKGE